MVNHKKNLTIYLSFKKISFPLKLKQQVKFFFFLLPFNRGTTPFLLLFHAFIFAPTGGWGPPCGDFSYFILGARFFFQVTTHPPYLWLVVFKILFMASFIPTYFTQPEILRAQKGQRSCYGLTQVSVIFLFFLLGSLNVFLAFPPRWGEKGLILFFFNWLGVVGSVYWDWFSGIKFFF